VESVNERGVDTAETPSAESGEDPDVDPTAFFKVEGPMGSPLEVKVVNCISSTVSLHQYPYLALSCIWLSHSIKTRELQCLQRLQNELASSFNKVVLKEVRETLQTNDCIQRESRLFGEPLVDDHMIKFWLSLEGYQEWLQQHQREISTNFIQLKGSYKFISKKRTGGQHIYLKCQRAGVQRERKGRTKGGKSGKPRVRQSSIKIGCPAKLQVVTQKRPGPDGGLQVVYEVTYLYQHNHGVGCFSSVGTRQKSEAIRATIKNLILGGSTISMVMHQLTMEHDKFTQIMRQKGRFSRDDFITYDDVYNIWHKIMVSKMRKDDDPIISSAKWMEELEKEGAFTYYDKGDHVGGLYFGFSTVWQMNQLKAYGRTICFDGTHDVFG